MNNNGKLYIGTSGWQYKHWAGTFYPETIKTKDHFAYYQSQFNTVELNNSFYHLPDKTTFKKWHDITPPHFHFAVKASRYITHMKKLKDPDEALHRFFLNAEALEEKLSVILFQLPPHWKLNYERLKEFLSRLPRGHRSTFEFRDVSWYQPEVFELLHKHHCSFCIYELDGHQSPEVITTNFLYIRLHGPGAKYQGLYTSEVLEQWAKKCVDWQQSGKDVFIYFDNDQDGYAAINARELQDIIQLMQLAA